MANCSAQDLLIASACFSCLSEKQLNVVIAGLLCEILQANNPMATCDPQTLLDDAACFGCLSEKQLNMVLAQLLCEILHGGGTGTTCLLCGVGAPTDDAPCDCSIYYSLPPAPGVWVWDTVNSVWDMILNPGP